MAKAKRSAKAHAEGRIVNNGHFGAPSQDASGGVEGWEGLGAGVLVRLTTLKISLEM
jgi:hypothetical protein